MRYGCNGSLKRWYCICKKKVKRRPTLLIHLCPLRPSFSGRILLSAYTPRDYSLGNEVLWLPFSTRLGADRLRRVCFAPSRRPVVRVVVGPPVAPRRRDSRLPSSVSRVPAFLSPESRDEGGRVGAVPLRVKPG